MSNNPFLKAAYDAGVDAYIAELTEKEANWRAMALGGAGLGGVAGAANAGEGNRIRGALGGAALGAGLGVAGGMAGKGLGSVGGTARSAGGRQMIREAPGVARGKMNLFDMGRGISDDAAEMILAQQRAGGSVGAGLGVGAGALGAGAIMSPGAPPPPTDSERFSRGASDMWAGGRDYLARMLGGR